MAILTRWGFLKKTSAGAVAMAALGAVPGVALAAARPELAPTHATELAGAEPFAVYVRDPARGEIVVLAGTQEITHIDRELAARLWRVQWDGRRDAAGAAHSGVR